MNNMDVWPGEFLEERESEMEGNGEGRLVAYSHKFQFRELYTHTKYETKFENIFSDGS